MGDWLKPSQFASQAWRDVTCGYEVGLEALRENSKESSCYKSFVEGKPPSSQIEASANHTDS